MEKQLPRQREPGGGSACREMIASHTRCETRARVHTLERLRCDDCTQTMFSCVFVSVYQPLRTLKREPFNLPIDAQGERECWFDPLVISNYFAHPETKLVHPLSR